MGDVGCILHLIYFFRDGKKNLTPLLPRSYFSPLGNCCKSQGWVFIFNCKRWCVSAGRARVDELPVWLLLLAPFKQFGAPLAKGVSGLRDPCCYLHNWKQLGQGPHCIPGTEGANFPQKASAPICSAITV